MRYSKYLGLALIGASILASGCASKKDNPQSDTSKFVTVKDGEFYIGDSLYRYVGTNFWYGAILASEGEGGNRERLSRELDTLQSIATYKYA